MTMTTLSLHPASSSSVDDSNPANETQWSLPQGAPLGLHRPDLIKLLRDEQHALLDTVDAVLRAAETGSLTHLRQRLDTLQLRFQRYNAREMCLLYAYLECFMDQFPDTERRYIRRSYEDSLTVKESLEVVLEHYTAELGPDTRLDNLGAQLLNLRFVLIDMFLDKQDRLFPLYYQCGSPETGDSTLN